MRIIADTNIIFSSFLKQNSRELPVILSGNYEIYFCYLSFIELFKHKEKIVQFSRLDENDILEIYSIILKNVKTINENEIPLNTMKQAHSPCKAIDENDTVFVAVAIFLDAHLWTGDKKLKNHLKKNGFEHFNALNMVAF